MMEPPKRAGKDEVLLGSILAALAEGILRHPELRVGQLIQNANRNLDLFYVEDEQLLKALRNYDP